MYHRSVHVLSLAFILLGAVLLATTLAHGGGPLSVGVLLGILFGAIGAGRLWVSARMSR